MNWVLLFIGVLIGWLIEWLIDYFYWRRTWQAKGAACQRDLEFAQAELQGRSQQLELCEQRKADLEARPAPAQRPDDLTVIEGIGPKISGILHEHGITTFAKLAEARVGQLQELLDGAGGNYQLADPATWPEQARLAAKGDWEQLQELKDRLQGGRRPQAR